MDGWQWLVAAGGGGQTEAAAPGGELAGGGQQGIPATKRDGKNTEMKRRTRGNHLGARKGGRGAGGADRRRGRSSGGGAVEERTSSGEWCSLERELGESYIGPRGERRGRG
jgi:hypothetical protein